MKVRQNYSFYRKLNEGVNEYDNRINALPIQHIGYAYFSSVNYNADRNQFALYPVWNGSINSMLEDPLPEGGFKIDVTVNEAADLCKDYHGIKIWGHFTSVNCKLYVKKFYIIYNHKKYEASYIGCPMAIPENVCFMGTNDDEGDIEDVLYRVSPSQKTSFGKGSGLGIKGFNNGSYRAHGSYRWINSSSYRPWGSNNIFKTGSYRGFGTYNTLGGTSYRAFGTHNSLGETSYRAFGTYSFLGETSYRAFGTYNFFSETSYRAFGTYSFLGETSYRAFGTYNFLSETSYRAFGTYNFLGETSYRAFGTYNFFGETSYRALGTYSFLGQSSYRPSGSYAYEYEYEYEQSGSYRRGLESNTSGMVIESHDTFPDFEKMINEVFGIGRMGYGLNLI